jgi:hypothetical protein
MTTVTVARADGTHFTVEAGGSLPVLDEVVPGPAARLNLAFSDTFVGALDTMVAYLSPSGPALFKVDELHSPYLSVESPVASASGLFDSSTKSVELTALQTAGGFTAITNARLPNGRRNGATTGGSLTLSDFRIDFTTRSIYAHVAGGNGVGFLGQRHIWNFAEVQGSTKIDLGFCPLTPITPCPPLGIQPLKLTGLTITDSAFGTVVDALGLTSALGVPSMQGVQDFGVITISSVPEPSVVALSLVGLMGLGVTSARRRKTAAPSTSQITEEQT